MCSEVRCFPVIHVEFMHAYQELTLIMWKKMSSVQEYACDKYCVHRDMRMSCCIELDDLDICIGIWCTIIKVLYFLIPNGL